VQSTSDLDCFHARDLPCSRVQSHDDPISDCLGDSAEKFPLYLYIYKDFALSLVHSSRLHFLVISHQ